MRAEALTYSGDLDPVSDVVVAADVRSVRPVVRAHIARLHPAWHADAACVGVPASVFFPAKGGKSTEARAICAGCPVFDACLTEALEDETLDHGIRAGYSVPERQRLRAERVRGVGREGLNG